MRRHRRDHVCVAGQRERTSQEAGWRVRIIVDGRVDDARSAARHLERFGCRVVSLRPQGLLVELPQASSRHDAEVEARLYLGMWHATHPDAVARVEPSPPAA